MPRRQTRVTASLAAALLCTTALSPRPTHADSAAPESKGVPTTGVRTITLPTIMTPMPQGPNQAIFIGNCTICHTPRYVLMQPPFPRKTWQAEVEKMKKVYGAPLADEQIAPIVDYLMAVRGNGQ